MCLNWCGGGGGEGDGVPTVLIKKLVTSAPGGPPLILTTPLPFDMLVCKLDIFVFLTLC